MPAPRRWIRLDVGWSRSEWLAELSPAARLAWVELLTYAKTDGTGGVVRAISPAVFGRNFGIPADDVRAMLEAAASGDDPALIVDEGSWIVSKWPDYQETDPTAADRMKRYRADRSRLSTTLQNRQNGVTPSNETTKPVTDVTRNVTDVTDRSGVTRHATVTVTGTPTETNEETATTAAEPAFDVENFVSSAIIAANHGMIVSGIEPYRPILTSHSSRQNVFDWLDAGVATETILKAVGAVASKAKKPIYSMAYFNERVMEAHERKKAEIHPDSQAGQIVNPNASKEDQKAQDEAANKRQAQGPRSGGISKPGEEPEPDDEMAIARWKREHPDRLPELQRKALEEAETKSGAAWDMVMDRTRERMVDGIMARLIRAELKAAS